MASTCLLAAVPGALAPAPFSMVLMAAFLTQIGALQGATATSATTASTDSGGRHPTILTTPILLRQTRGARTGRAPR